MKRDIPRFASEAEMCASFIEQATAAGRRRRSAEWIAYNETAGWDILLVRATDGFQIGIQAKLRLSMAVIAQAIEDESRWDWANEYGGPDCRAILVPGYATENGATAITAYLGLTVIKVHKEERGRLLSFSPSLPDETWDHTTKQWHERSPLKRCELPEYVPDVAAGMSGPVKLTDWKLRALRMMVLLEERPVTRADFKALRIDPSRWMAAGYGWLVRAPDAPGFVPGPRLPDFRAQHPVVYEQVKADRAKWDPAATRPKEGLSK